MESLCAVRRATSLGLLSLIIVLGACSSEVGSGEVFDLDSESKDASTFVDLSTIPIFWVNCDLAQCDYRMTLPPDVPGLAVVYTGIQENVEYIRTIAHDEEMFNPEGFAQSSLIGSGTFELDEESDQLVANFTTTRGAHYGLVFARDAEPGTYVDLNLRVTPRFGSARDLPADLSGDHEYRVDGQFSSSSRDTWTISVTDVTNLSNPTVSIRALGDVSRMTVYYECEASGVTTSVDVQGDPIGQKANFTMDCSGFNDGGALYMELNGRGTYSLTVDVE